MPVDATASPDVRAAEATRAASRPRWRELAAPAAASLEAGLYGGAAVFLVEAVDRAVTLWPSFNSAAEPLLFAAYLAPSILLGLAAGVAIGAVLLVLRAAFLGASRFVNGPAAFALTTAAVGLLVWLAIRSWPDTVEAPLFRLVRKINGKLVHIGFVVDHFSGLLLVGIFAGAALVLALAIALGAESRPRQRLWRALGAAALLAGAVTMYALDSRFLYGRYESVIHIPAAAAAFALAFLAAGVARGLVGSRRALAAGALAVFVLGLAASAFDLLHVGRNENLKALLWRRGVVARRAYQLADAASDRDGDGFSALFGGDLDDRDPNVHPLATEVPGNGVDDNCFGGDAATRPPAPPVGDARAASPSVPGYGRSFLYIAIEIGRAHV